jgi:hypothetical protein
VEYATQFGTSIAAITKSLSDNVIVGINNAVVAAGAVSDNIGLKLTTTAAGTRNVAASTATQISDYAADATKMASNAITHVYSLISKSNDPSSKE